MFLKCPCRCSSEKRLSKWATVIRRNMFRMWEWTFMLSCYKKCTSDYKVRIWGFHQSLTWKHKAHKTNPLHDALSSCIALETSCVQHPTCCDEATEVTGRNSGAMDGLIWTEMEWLTKHSPCAMFSICRDLDNKSISAFPLLIPTKLINNFFDFSTSSDHDCVSCRWLRLQSVSRRGKSWRLKWIPEVHKRF